VQRGYLRDIQFNAFAVYPFPRSGAEIAAVKRALRIAVSISLLTLLLVRLDWTAVSAHLGHLQPRTAALLVIALAVQLALSSWKWRWALRIYELHFPYMFLSRVLVIGFFLNNFLPTSIGGDAYRVYRTIPTTPPKSRAISAVLLERLVGISALSMLGLAGALALYHSSKLARAYVLLAVGGAALALVLVVWITRPDWHTAVWMKSPWLAPIKDTLHAVTHARMEWLPLIAISLLFQAQAIFIMYELFLALNVPISLAQSALIAAAAGFATVIPLSINGLGIVEASIAGVGLAVGVSYEAGLLVALLMRILVMPLTLAAGLLYAFEPVHARAISNPFPQ
jgi:uncharacterized membrane protein YbhN (UPF0104 family)